VRGNVQDDQYVFQVSDNGPGVPPAEQPYIFDKFFRASNISSETPGSGLGLAIVKSIVENHHGRIWVDSTLASGSIFTVVLPVSGKAQ
jgi:signal transduction histidine kinase